MDANDSSSPRSGRFDANHTGLTAYDNAVEAARRNADDLGSNVKSIYDPETGTLIGEMSADGKRGWRIDAGHVNWWNWAAGKKGRGGRYGHEFFPPQQAGPHSKHMGYAPWQ